VDGVLASEAVLVSRWVDGVALGQLEGEARDRAAELFLRFHVGAALFGTVQADPDPRDALLDAGGRLWVLDFGASRRVVPDRVALTAAALDALAAGDGRRLGALLGQLGWLEASDGHEALTLARGVAGPLLGTEAVSTPTPCARRSSARSSAAPRWPRSWPAAASPRRTCGRCGWQPSSSSSWPPSAAEPTGSGSPGGRCATAGEPGALTACRPAWEVHRMTSGAAARSYRAAIERFNAGDLDGSSTCATRGSSSASRRPARPPRWRSRRC
jgi:hypothetical protein